MLTFDFLRGYHQALEDHDLNHSSKEDYILDFMIGYNQAVRDYAIDLPEPVNLPYADTGMFNRKMFEKHGWFVIEPQEGFPSDG